MGGALFWGLPVVCAVVITEPLPTGDSLVTSPCWGSCILRSRGSRAGLPSCGVSAPGSKLRGSGSLKKGSPPSESSYPLRQTKCEERKGTQGNLCLLALVLCCILSAETQGRHQNTAACIPGCALRCPSAPSLASRSCMAASNEWALAVPCVWCPLYPLASSVVNAGSFLKRGNHLPGSYFFLTDLGGVFL